jgi:hypothetical protein
MARFFHAGKQQQTSCCTRYRKRHHHVPNENFNIILFGVKIRHDKIIPEPGGFIPEPGFPAGNCFAGSFHSDEKHRPPVCSQYRINPDL